MNRTAILFDTPQRAASATRRRDMRRAEREWRSRPARRTAPEHAFDDRHPWVFALLVMLGASLFYFGIFYLGTTLGAWLQQVMP